MITFDFDIPQLLNLLLAVVFPVLVGLVTTRVTASRLKAILLATISLASGLVSGLLTAILAGVPFDLASAALTGLAAWIIALATHLGFWKPTGITAVVQGIGSPPLTTWTRQEREDQDARDADVDAFNARVDGVDIEDIASMSTRLRRDAK